MALIENTFNNQSALDDEYKGAAETSATGGTSSGSTNSSSSTGKTGTSTDAFSSDTSTTSLTSAKANILNKLNSKPAGTLFKDGKFVFPDKLLSEFKLAELVNGIQDSISKGLSISQALQNGLNNMVNSFISQLKSDSSETWTFLQKAGGSFVNTLKDKIKGFLMSKMYVPDLVFLAGLKPIGYTGSNISYKGDYVRNLCIKHDMPLSLEYVDKRKGIRYTNENTKGVNDAIKAARYGSFNVSFYIMNKLKAEINELKDCYPLPKNYNRKSEETIKSNYADKINVIKMTQKAMNTNSPVYIALEKQLEEYQRLSDSLFINKEDKYLEDNNYKKIQTLINTGNKNLCRIMKAVIVYSYSNLLPNTIRSKLNKYDIPASAFGTSDKDFGRCAVISNSDINVMAPFYTPKKNNSVIEQTKEISKKSSLIPDVKIKFISPRNIHVKGIYITLASKNLNTKNMVNKPLYERLKYPVYSTVIEAADSALAGLYKVGIGKTLVGAINSIEEAFYVYAKSLEPYLYSAAKTDYISYNDLRTLPAPTENEIKSNSTSNKNSGRKTSNTNTISSKCMRASGTTVPTSLDTYDNLIDSMTEIELNRYIGDNCDGKYSDSTLSSLSIEQKRIIAKEISNNKKIDTNNIIDNYLSDDSLRKYIKKCGTTLSDEELLSMSRDNLKKISKENANKMNIDYTTLPGVYMINKDRKRYLRKYFGYTEYELSKNSDEKNLGLFNKKINSTKRRIFYPVVRNEFCGYDAEGFPILGYPDTKIVEEATVSGNIGYYSENTRNGFPATSKGYTCPIIGYDAYGKAMYGTPVFYPTTTPISHDSRQCPVFSYSKDDSILIEMDTSESEVNSKLKENDKKIDNLNKYIANGASGVLKISYTNQIKALTQENNTYKELLSWVKTSPVVGYDENDNIIYGEVDPSLVITTDEGTGIGYDENGSLVYGVNNKGETIIGYDSNNNPIIGSKLLSPIGKDMAGQYIYGYDQNNMPIYKFTSSTINKLPIGKTNKNELIYEYVTYESPVPVVGYDKNGKTILNHNSNLTISEKNELNTKIEYYNTKIAEYTNLMNNSDSDEIKSRYALDIKNMQNNLNIYNRIKNESPTPPTIGYNEEGIPILGVRLLYEVINDIPNLNYASEESTTVDSTTVTNADPNNFSESESIMDKTDIDIDKDFTKYEREMMVMDIEKETDPYVLKIMYYLN